MFLKNHTQNAMEIIFPYPFLKNQNWPYLWISILKFHTACFHGMPSWGLSEHIETKLQTTCFYLISSFFKKTKGLELVSLSHFLHDFWKKYLACYILLPGQISLSGCLDFARFFCMTKMSTQKFKDLENKESFLKWNKKHF